MQRAGVLRLLLLVCASAIVLASDASAQKDEVEPTATTPLSASVDRGVKGGGRTAISITPIDGPEAHSDELATHPTLPAIDCPDSTVIAATKQLGPSLIPLARSGAYELSCVLRYRGATAPFTVKVPAPTPGLYGELSNPQPGAGDKSLVIRPFLIRKGKSSARPARLRAGASAGSIALGANNGLTYSLPESAAPRALAVVFTDGKRGGAVFMPFIGKTELPVKARRKTNVRVRISGRWFGPIEMRKPRMSLDIEVPPGVRDAVVQAVGARGNVTETFADLKTPQMSRIAAVATDDAVKAGKSVDIYVALASRRGGASQADVQIVAEAQEGTVSDAVSQGPGLWKLTYKAGATASSAEVRISVANDADAGEAIVPVRVVAGTASKFEFKFAKEVYQPGETIEGTLRVTDSHGNAVPAEALKLTLAGQTLVATPSETGTLIKATVPNELTPKRELVLVASIGAASAERVIKTVAGPVVSATIVASVDEREAKLRVVPSDSFGNTGGTSSLTLVADAASAGALVDEGDWLSTVVTANAGARSTLVRVLHEGKELATKTVTFEPPGSAILLGAYVYGAWSSNGGELSVPRAGLGIGTRRRFGPIEVALLVGAEAFASEDTVVAMVAGMDQKLIRQLRGIAIPVLLRGRVRVNRKFGAALAFGVTPTATSARLAQDKSENAFNAWTNGVRGELSGDYKLGQGRVILGTSYGRTKLAEGPIVGDIDGFRVYAGYEVWPLDFGP